MTGQMLKGKVAIVTGAARNLGRAFSEMLGQEGAAVVVHYHLAEDKADAVKTAQMVKDAGGDAVIFEAELGEVNKIEEMFDLAINNSGAWIFSSIMPGRLLKNRLLKSVKKNSIACFASMLAAHFSVCAKLPVVWRTTAGLLTSHLAFGRDHRFLFRVCRKQSMS